MDCGGEDANTLLSLSQSLLQSERSSSAALSSGQLSNWPPVSSTSVDVTGQFSPVSPVDCYGGNNNAPTDSTLRFYGYRPAGNQEVPRTTDLGQYSRVNDCSTVDSSSESVFPAANRLTGAGTNGLFHNVTGHSSNAIGNENMQYDQDSNLRAPSDLYCTKELSRLGGNAEVSSHRLDNTQGHQGFSHSGSHNFSSMQENVDTGKSVGLNRNMESDLVPNFFDSRAKQSEFSKDMDVLYGQLSSKTNAKQTSGYEFSLPFDRRSVEVANFDTDFDFSSSSREFQPSGRVDLSMLNRGVQQLDYHSAPMCVDGLPQSSLPQKYSIPTHSVEPTPQFLNSSLPLNSSQQIGSSKRGIAAPYVSFNLGEHEEAEEEDEEEDDDEENSLQMSEQKKSIPGHQFSDFPSDLDPVLHGTPTDYASHHKLSLESQKNLSVEDFRESEETLRIVARESGVVRDSSGKRNGRSRAHFKMTRILGNEDLKERLSDTQSINQSNSSHKQSTTFTRTMFADDQESGKDQMSKNTDVQGNFSYPLDFHRDLSGNSRSFLTMEEELDMRTIQHQQRRYASRRNEDSERHGISQRETGFLQANSLSLDSSSVPLTAMHKDTMSGTLSSQSFLPSSQLDLDFHQNLSMSQSQRELEMNQQFMLQDPKDFDYMDNVHGSSSQDDLCFDTSVDPQHASQPELSLTDNLNMGPQNQQDLSLDAYFSSTSDRDIITFPRKLPNQISRDMSYMAGTPENDFNIEEYMNTQSQKDLSQVYFDRSDLPQDMTMYQKSSTEKSTVIPDTTSMSKGRDKFDSGSATIGKQGVEISELQKELTKTSTKESVKGIRIPRDINRAMGILQGLQEDEKEEARRKQQLQEEQLQKQQLQQQLQQSQQMNNSLISSPKKTFQNKHQIENMSMPDQHFLGAGNFMDEQPVGNMLEQTNMTDPVQQSDGLQIIPSYQPFISMHQTNDLDLSSSLSSKRDPLPNSSHPTTTDLDYHILKRLALSTAATDTSIAVSSTFSNHPPAITPVLSNVGTSSTHEQSISFPGISHFQNQLAILDDDSSKFLPHSNHSDRTRPRDEFQFMDFEPRQQLASEKSQVSASRSDENIINSTEITQVLTVKREAEVLATSRQNLYSMMKYEQFCDAILSTPKQTVKVHQAILCSMSQYLCTLLHKMKPLHGPPSFPLMSPSSSYPSQNSWNQGVLLVINCDSIKTSSMSSFLTFIYLGKTEFSKSNVLDLYILACSLRISLLKDLCKEFMWEAHISEDQTKVPQLLVSNQRLETRDQACFANLDSERTFEDMATNTGSSGKSMEVATQTDRSTSEAGEGGQEEWVMLKKTKQKTVSPSKSRMVMKSSTGVDSSHHSLKGGKKGWLSPKRRYKTENQLEHFTMVKEVVKEPSEIELPDANASFKGNQIGNELNMGQPYLRINKLQSGSKDTSLHNGKKDVSLKQEQTLQKRFSSQLNEDSGTVPPLLVDEALLPLSKTARTTVEIAAAAAAARLSAHNYGTRSAKGGNKSSLSYTSLASGLEKKRSMANQKDKPSTCTSKKKDFIKSNVPGSSSYPDLDTSIGEMNVVSSSGFQHSKSPVMMTSSDSSLKPQVSSCSGDLNLNLIEMQNGTESFATAAFHFDEDPYKNVVKRPLKKSIVHRSQSEEVLKSTDILSSTIDNSRNAVETHFELDTSNSNTLISGNLNSVGDLIDHNVNNVSNFIDSIVNTIESEQDMDLQKVIRDLDSEFCKSPSLITAQPTTSVSTSSSSSSSSSSSTLLKSAYVPDTSPCIKSKPTPQGFRKRLIQLINSEKHTSTPQYASLQQNCDTIVPQDDPVTMISVGSGVGFSTTDMAVTVTLGKKSSMQAGEPSCDLDMPQPIIANSDKTSTKVQEVEKDLHQVLDQRTTNDTTDVGLGNVEKESAPAAGGPGGEEARLGERELGLREDDGQQFHHKIFKRKKRSKTKRMVVVETEGASSAVKMKLKKVLTLDVEGGCGVVKSRQRKYTGSDTEGGGIRPKQKKTNDIVGTLAKVRPPPKKRAKMELELLKAANTSKMAEENEGKSSKAPSDHHHLKTEKCMEPDKENYEKKTCDKSNCESREMLDDVNVNQAETETAVECDNIKESKEKTRPQVQTALNLKEKKRVANPDTTELSILKLTMETKLTLMLEQMAKPKKLTTIPYTCKLCQIRLKSALRTVRHMRSHMLEEEGEILANIAVGENSSRKACELCGYVTKDESYVYMHYHKYFKHGVALPPGWSSNKCEICGKECHTRFQLKEHTSSHKEEQCFVCTHCGQIFKSRNNFNNHMFHRHMNERKHQCKACGKSFKTWSQLKVHVRSHTGERPYKCPECDYGSTTQGNMKKHMTRRHKYSKDKIQATMKKMCKDAHQLNPKALEGAMEEFVLQGKADSSKSDLLPSEKKLRNVKVKRKVEDVTASAEPTDNNSDKSRRELGVNESKSAGKNIKRLLTDPPCNVKPPKLLIPRLSSTSDLEMAGNLFAIVSTDKTQQASEEVNGDLDSSCLSILLQHDQQLTQGTGPLSVATETLFVPLSQAEQNPCMSILQQQQLQQRQQQQQQQQQMGALGSSQCLLGYTLIPSSLLPVVSLGLEVTTVDSCPMPTFSGPHMVMAHSGLTPGLSSVQPLTTDCAGLVCSTGSSGVMPISQDAGGHTQDKAIFMDSAQNSNLLQTSSLSLQETGAMMLCSEGGQPQSDSALSVDFHSFGASTDSIVVVQSIESKELLASAGQLTNPSQGLFTYPYMAPQESMMMPVQPGMQVPPGSFHSGGPLVNISTTVSISEELRFPVNTMQQTSDSSVTWADGQIICSTTETSVAKTMRKSSHSATDGKRNAGTRSVD